LIPGLIRWQPDRVAALCNQPLGRQSLTGSVFAQAAFYSGPSGPLFF